MHTMIITNFLIQDDLYFREIKIEFGYFNHATPCSSQLKFLILVFLWPYLIPSSCMSWTNSSIPESGAAYIRGDL